MAADGPDERIEHGADGAKRTHACASAAASSPSPPPTSAVCSGPSPSAWQSHTLSVCGASSSESVTR